MDKSEVCLITVHGGGRPEILEAQKSVFSYFGWSINQICEPLIRVGHGVAIDSVLNNLCNDFVNSGIKTIAFIDSDCICLNENSIPNMIDKVKDNNSIAGCIQNSGHLFPNNNVWHPYIGAFCFWISTELYLNLGRPTFNHIDDYGDTAENLTWECEKRGYGIYGLYPSHSVGKEYDLPHGLKFGHQTTYGNSWFHCFRQDLSESKQIFLDKCKEITNGK